MSSQISFCKYFCRPFYLPALALAAGAFLIVSPAFALQPRPNSSDLARKQIQAIYSREDHAASRKDLQTIFADMAPDFSAIDQNGQKMGLAEVKANLVDLFSHASTVTGATTIQKFRLMGRTAVVTTKSRDEMTVTDPDGNQTGKLTIDDLSVDTWVRSGKTWLQTRSRDISQTVHTDRAKPAPSYDPMLS